MSGPEMSPGAGPGGAPGVSIVVPSRGGAHRLPLLLDSVAAQTDVDAVEVVVVVDGDVDGSEQVVAARRDVGDIDVRAVVLPENLGRAAALNAGFAAARGEVLVRCDDDLELEPDFAAHHLRLHERPGGPRGVVTMCVEVYAEPTAYSEVFGRPADDRIRDLALRTDPDRRWRWWSGCVSVTREVLDRVGPYDTAYRTYGWEDIDWGYRLHRAGVPIEIPRGFTTRHHGPVTSVRDRARRALHSGGARLTFERLHGPESLAAPMTAEPERRTAWTRLVECASTIVTERSVAAAGDLLDRTIAHSPRPLAEKGVSLLVEAASEAGRRHPDRITTVF